MNREQQWDRREPARRQDRRRRGLTLIEVMIAMMVASTVLISSAYAFTASMRAVQQARKMTQAAAFLETVMENVGSQPYANLAALNGNQLFDGANAGASQYSVTLAVFANQVNLMQVRATLVDLSTNREIARLTTLRANR
jgi:prepilin-type N-terminal cleavage/methylation domain-containing protein